MSRSVRLTRVAVMDRAIEDVNCYYNGRWRVKAKRFMRKYVFSSWQLLTFLAAIMMLLLTTLYGCRPSAPCTPARGGSAQSLSPSRRRRRTRSMCDLYAQWRS